MNEREWVEILGTIDLMWPDRKRWPDSAARRCYRLLAGVDEEVVHAALDRLKGPHPPSPALLEETVSVILADRAYNRPVPELPEPRGTIDHYLESVGAASLVEDFERRVRERTE